MFSLELVPSAWFQSSSRVTKHVLITHPCQALSHSLPLLPNSLCVCGGVPASHSALKSGSFLTLPSLLQGLLVLQHQCHFPAFHSPMSDFLACHLVCGTASKFPPLFPIPPFPFLPPLLKTRSVFPSHSSTWVVLGSWTLHCLSNSTEAHPRPRKPRSSQLTRSFPPCAACRH